MILSLARRLVLVRCACSPARKGFCRANLIDRLGQLNRREINRCAREPTRSSRCARSACLSVWPCAGRRATVSAAAAAAAAANRLKRLNLHAPKFNMYHCAQRPRGGRGALISAPLVRRAPPPPPPQRLLFAAAARRGTAAKRCRLRRRRVSLRAAYELRRAAAPPPPPPLPAQRSIIMRAKGPPVAPPSAGGATCRAAGESAAPATLEPTA